MNRYQVMGAEGEFEPGSNNQVLKNHLGITNPDEIDEVEASLLFKLYEKVFKQDVSLLKSLTVKDIQAWHKSWLGNVYSWAGSFRTVNMGKGGFDFAAARNIKTLITRFESSYLNRFNCLDKLSTDELADYLARSHVEFILIHPFREGNGRLSRLLLDVMAVKAGLAPLDYSLWEQHREFYFKSIQAGHNEDYSHTRRMITDTLKLQG